jgi:hypothetical protein
LNHRNKKTAKTEETGTARLRLKLRAFKSRYDTATQ